VRIKFYVSGFEHVERRFSISLHHLVHTLKIMLTTRGAVARLSKRSFKSVKQTNTFFSTAAVLQRSTLSTGSQQRSALPRASPVTPSAGKPFSYYIVFDVFFICLSCLFI
jgi:hypothetical protein